MRTVESGTHDPLGATLTLEGTNFALFQRLIPLRGSTRRVWHAFVKGVGAGRRP